MAKFVALWRAHTDLAVGLHLTNTNGEDKLTLSKATAYILRHARDHEAECSKADKKKSSNKTMSEEVNYVTTFNLLRDLTSTTDKESWEICWDPHSARRN